LQEMPDAHHTTITERFDLVRSRLPRRCGMSDPTDIPVWRRLDGQITTSGQPSERQLGEIRDLGVGHVINLALHSHEKALPDEAGTVAALGMTYVHIPVEFDRPTKEDFQRFCAAMAEIGDKPVHVHCIVNARVSAFLYRYRREVLGWDEARARSDLETVWQPGGVWAEFIGDKAAISEPHRYTL
jgi:protein tyrosine phosphatase (PTP) superfamily phosphohydrolase (DUF442 family)